jgi:glutathione S-transferase
MYRLYYYPGNASLAPHLVLAELAVAYELSLVDRSRDQQKSAEYLALNPKGVIPTLVAGELILTEATAICMHLVDRHPDGELAPPVGTPARARFYEWMVYLTNTVQAESMLFHYPEDHLGDAQARAELAAMAEQRLERCFRHIDSQIANAPYLLGERVSACDLYLLMLARWARGMQRPPRCLPGLGALLERLLARPAVRRCLDAEGIEEPFV